HAGSSTTPGTASATGPFIRKPSPKARPASSHRPSNAAVIVTVMKKASGRARSARRARGEQPKPGSANPPASHPTPARPRMPAAAGGVGGKRDADAGQSRPRPRRPLADADQDVHRGCEPVVEHRLLPAILVVVMRRQPVAPLDHLARRLGVERLVRIADGRAA